MQNTFSRRRFLGVAAGAAGASLFHGPLTRAAFSVGEPTDYVIGVQSYSLRAFDAETAIQHAADIGFGTIEFYKNHIDALGTDEAAQATKAIAVAAGLGVLVHGVNSLTGDEAANRKYFEFAKRLGLKVISAHPTPDSFDNLDRLVAEFDVKVGIHNHGPDHQYDTLEDVLNPLEGRHPNLGACIDTGHFIRSGVDPVEAIERLGDRVHSLHLKDFAEETKTSEERILGQGLLDPVDMFRALRKIEFPLDSALSVEYEHNMQDPIDDLKACLDVAKEAVARTA